MNKNFKKLSMALIAVLLSSSILGGCSSSGQTSTSISQDNSENNEAYASNTYKPSDLVIGRQDSYIDQSMGLKFTLPETLLRQMDSQEIAMISQAEVNNDDTYHYAFFSWNTMTKEQRDAEVPVKGEGFYDWADGLERIGSLGVYESGQIENLDSLTKCREHKELGKSSDGVYTYYLSINPDTDKELSEALGQIHVEIIDMVPIEEEGMDGVESGSLGGFSMQDIKDNIYTEEMFQDYELTMINVFTTWCTPCVNEIPDLNKLYVEMKEKGVNVVGIILDAVDQSGNVDAQAIEKAKILAERTKASYPFLIPDAGMLDGRLKEIEAVPETFFVDKNGTIVGKSYSGSHDLEDWRSIVKTELDSLPGGKQ